MRSLWASSHDVLETCALYTRMHALSLTTLVNSRPGNTAPDLNQPMFQFIGALGVCMVNTFLNGRPYLIVN